MAHLRIKGVEIEEFRCFAAAHLDLSSDVVAIFGRNGAGKTTVFDAIEFALFGGISRLESSGATTDFVSLVGGQGTPRVRVDLQSLAGDHHVETMWSREANSLKEIRGSAAWHTHRDLLFDLLVDADWFAGRREVAAVRELFRATTMLSQDSIRRFVESGPEERAKVLAGLSGFAHIQRSKDKAEDVVRLADRNHRQLATELQEALSRVQVLDSDVAEIDGRSRAILERLSDDVPTYEEVCRALDAAGVKVDSNTPAKNEMVAFTKAIQARCDERLSGLQSRIERFAIVEAGFQSHLSRKGQMRKLSKEAESLRDQAGALDVQQHALAVRSRDAAKKAADLSTQAREASEVLQALQEQHDASRRAVHLEAQLSAARESIASLESALQPLKNRLAKLQKAHAELADERQSVAASAESLDAELAGLTRVRDALPRYGALCSELASTRSRLSSAEGELRHVNERIAEAEQTVTTLRDKFVEAQEAMSQTEAVADEHAELALRLRSMATNQVCPLCGTQHSSNASLLEAIDQSLRGTSEPAKAANARLQTAQTQLSEAQRLIEAMAEQQAELIEITTTLRGSVERHRTEKRRIESEGASVGVELLDTEVHSKVDAAETRRRALLEELRRLDEALRRAAKEVSAVEADMRATEARVFEDREAERNLNVRLQQANTRVSRLQDPGHPCAPVGGVLEALQQAERVHADLDEQRARAEQACGIAEGEEESLDRERERVRRRLVSVDEESGSVNAEIERFRSHCDYLGFSKDPTERDIESTRRKLDEGIKAVRMARNLTKRLELGSLLPVLEEQRQSVEKEKAEAYRLASQLEERRECSHKALEVARSWIDLLTTDLANAVQDMVSSHQAEIEHHFRAMIPSPHLFDSITMHHAGDRLEIAVRYRGQLRDAGEPRMFLSNAQLNVLALAVFLSLGAKQQWSHLDTLLLDDPIQHLDDLDAVAFLDTLRAVVLGRLGRKRQVVVSTCDKNLYHLMIQKFRPLQETGTGFTAISLVQRGMSGPLVHYDVGGSEASARTA